jgi:TonB family protein
MTAVRRERDPFRQMLVWSIVLHGLAFTAVTLAAGLRTSRHELPAPVGEFMNINLGQSGPLQGSGGGGAPPPKPSPVEPPKEKEPTVVRPTKEDREELPMPDAPVGKKPQEKKPDSGLRGADAASAASAPLAPSGIAGPPGLGLGGAGGGSPFDQDFEYAYYVQQMLAKISQHWQRTAVRGTAVAVVRFTIARDGRIQDAEVETTSGLSILDRSALRAVMLSDPLPPLPNSYPRDQVGVHLRFTYTDQP